MNNTPNAQLNYAAPHSLAIRLSTRTRRKIFKMFMDEFQPAADESVLDVGVTSDQSYDNSNYFEALYPYRDRIVAVGLQAASFLEQMYIGLRYVEANALSLPFRDRSFDLVHSAAVLEHVGSIDNQAAMISECVRVARRGICLTTPNRWFPVEFHTQLPFVHWLPKRLGRHALRKLGFADVADEAQLNLMTSRELNVLTAAIPGWSFRIASPRLLGWKSNLLLFGRSDILQSQAGQIISGHRGEARGRNRRL
jgi:ubiquinone/menaquinone biosynthesis C-methylase UbiE